MEDTSIKISLIIILVTISLVLHANIAHGKEDPWRKRMIQAKKAAWKAYEPHPQLVVAQTNEEVQRSTEGVLVDPRENNHEHNGRCVATNPIDQCWRCQPNWAHNRERLADCVLGFGRHTTGGKYGKIYVVNDPSDDHIENPRPGTLRHAVIQLEPLWIVFRHSMVIKLKQELIMTSNKTIDGRGAQVHIAYGAGMTLQYVTNVIIHGVHIHDIKPGRGGLIRDAADHAGHRGPSDGDGISIFSSSNIWIDHVSMSNCNDGLIDIIEGSTAVTISNSHFTQHNKALLFGGHDRDLFDSRMQVTLAFNHFGRNIVQRVPRVRFGFVHIVNNDYRQWLMYAIGGSQNPTIISHGNHFLASRNPYAKQVTRRENAGEREWSRWLWKSEGDVFENGAYFKQSGNLRKFSFSTELRPVDGSFARHLTTFSGVLNCIRHHPC